MAVLALAKHRLPLTKYTFTQGAAIWTQVEFDLVFQVILVNFSFSLFEEDLVMDLLDFLNLTYLPLEVVHTENYMCLISWRKY